MEMKFDTDQIPSIVYMEFETENGKSFVVFQDGILQENIKAIMLIHSQDEYALDFKREIGFTE